MNFDYFFHLYLGFLIKKVYVRRKIINAGKNPKSLLNNKIIPLISFLVKLYKLKSVL